VPEEVRKRIKLEVDDYFRDLYIKEYKYWQSPTFMQASNERVSLKIEETGNYQKRSHIEKEAELIKHMSNAKPLHHSPKEAEVGIRESLFGLILRYMRDTLASVVKASISNGA